LLTNNDIRAIIPPSPLLSIRIAKNAYLTEVTRIIVQIISDSKPKITEGSGLFPDSHKIVFSVYSGLVPISPKLHQGRFPQG
jgi:hypothetical protein